MRKMTMILGDEKKYTFKTLSMLKTLAFQNSITDEEKEETKRIADLTTKEDGDGLTAAEMNELQELLSKQADDMDDQLALVRESLSKSHPEFGIDCDNSDSDKLKKEIKAKNDKILELIDLRDFQIIIQFITSGAIPKLEADGVIDGVEVVV